MGSKHVRSLHEVKQPLAVPVVFFGPDFPCMDGYHNGFRGERTTPREHADCATNALRPPGTPLIPGEVWHSTVCDCECNQNNDHAHWFIESDAVHRERFYRRHIPPGLCRNCQLGIHPSLDPELRDKRENAVVGTPNDGNGGMPEPDFDEHEHEWDDDGFCMHCDVNRGDL